LILQVCSGLYFFESAEKVSVLLGGFMAISAQKWLSGEVRFKFNRFSDALQFLRQRQMFHDLASSFNKAASKI
jgi:hypothetical protein